MSTEMISDEELARELNELYEQEEHKELLALLEQEAKSLRANEWHELCGECRRDVVPGSCYCVRIPAWDQMT